MPDQEEHALMEKYRLACRMNWLCWASAVGSACLGAWGVLEWMSPRSDNLWAVPQGFIGTCSFVLFGVVARQEVAHLKRKIDTENPKP
jgi:hypothetical protein